MKKAKDESENSIGNIGGGDGDGDDDDDDDMDSQVISTNGWIILDDDIPALLQPEASKTAEDMAVIEQKMPTVVAAAVAASIKMDAENVHEESVIKAIASPSPSPSPSSSSTTTVAMARTTCGLEMSTDTKTDKIVEDIRKSIGNEIHDPIVDNDVAVVSDKNLLLTSGYDEQLLSDDILQSADDEEDDEAVDHNSDDDDDDDDENQSDIYIIEHECDSTTDTTTEAKANNQPAVRPVDERVKNLHEDISDGFGSSFSNYAYDLTPGIRAYRHVPNRMMNLKLNLFLAFAVVAGVFLGVGNYIGWSDNVQHNVDQLSSSQVAKLKHLQDELVVCMQAQDLSSDNDVNQIKMSNVCYLNSAHWKARFEKLFLENEGLRESLEKTQQQLWIKANQKASSSSGSKAEDCSGNAKQEFDKLKLDFIVKQMEHLQLLKTFEEVKQSERLSKLKLNRLMEENSDLRKKLKEEEEDDKVLEQTMEERISNLEMENTNLKNRLRKQNELNLSDNKQTTNMQIQIKQLLNENNELKAALRKLENQMGFVDGTLKDKTSSTASTSTGTNDEGTVSITDQQSGSKQNDGVMKTRIDDIRERINQVIAENQDLRAMIARLRWLDGPAAATTDAVDDVESKLQLVLANQEETKRLNLQLIKEQKEKEKWKQLYENSVKQQQQQQQQQENEKASGKSRENSNEFNSNEKKPEEGQKFSSDWFNNFNFSYIQMNFSTEFRNAFGSLIQDIIKQGGSDGIELPRDVVQLLNGTRVLLNELHREMLAKWSEVQSFGKTVGTNGRKASKKMLGTLQSGLQKIKEAVERYTTTQKPLRSRMNKLASKVAKVRDWLGKKWSTLKSRYASKQQNVSSETPDMTSDEEEEEEQLSSEEIRDDLLFDDEISSEQIKSSSNTNNENSYSNPDKRDDVIGNWLFVRAQDRQSQRNDKGDTEEANENWFLKKGKRWKSYESFV